MFEHTVSAIFYQQIRSGHHGTSGVPVGALMVIRSKSVSEDVLPPTIANVLEK